jgi:pimeloyl-ACP methyl ester carboxylesterase
MSAIKLGAHDTLYYEHQPPAQGDRNTFVFFNALTGDVGMWNAEVVPALNRQGYGTLTYNLRGQANSSFSDPRSLDCDHIIDDALMLLNQVNPAKPMLVGLSIGGLFAAHAMLRGASADGLVLINTVRRNGPRLRWINDALVRCAEFGGLELFRDLFCPLLFNESWQAANRSKFLVHDRYHPIDRSSGIYHLLKHAADADWDLNYERLTVPTLVLTGLQDRVFLDLEDVAALATRIPNIRRKDQPEAGHMLPAESPRWLIDTLVDFAEHP